MYDKYINHMSNIQKYRSKNNIKIENETKPQIVTQQKGEETFTIEANTSLKLVINFKSEFATVPILTTTLILNDSNNDEFDVSHTVIAKTNKSFIVAIQSVSQKTLSGTIQYIALI